jgi:hypothetical protein
MINLIQILYQGKATLLPPALFGGLNESLMHRHACILDRSPIMMKMMQETRRANSAHRRYVARFQKKLKAETEDSNYKILTQLLANEFAKAKQ